MSLCPNSSIESVHVLKHNSFLWNFISTMTLFLRKMEAEDFIFYGFNLYCVAFGKTFSLVKCVPTSYLFHMSVENALES